MFSVNVVLCCKELDDAVTVTVDVMGVKPLLLLPLPQPADTSRASTHPEKISLVRRQLHPQPKQPRRRTRARLEFRGGELRIDAEADEVETVRVVDAVAPNGVTVDGLKLHDAPEGKPEQANETADEKPFWGDTETEALPLCPCSIVKVDGAIGFREKLGIAIV